MTSTLAASLLPLLMMIAGLGDFLTYRIPNRLTLAIAGLFFPMAWATGMPLEAVLGHGLIALGLLALGFALFAAGWFGGGDAKLMAAAGLWYGWPHALTFLVDTALAGGVLAAAVGLWSAIQVDQEIKGHGRMRRWLAAKPHVPYGLALAAGAILAFPGTWWMAFAR